MRFLTVLLFVVLTACGGGGSKSTGVTEPEPPTFALPTFYSYEIKQVGESMGYEGVAMRGDNVMISHPLQFTRSGFDVVGEFYYTFDESDKSIDVDLQLYAFGRWGVVRQGVVTLVHQGGSSWVGSFTMNGAEFDMTLNGRSVAAAGASLANLSGNWNVINYSSSVIDATDISLDYNNGQLTGSTSTGCTIAGSVSVETAVLYGVTLQVSDCAEAGTYDGLFYQDGDELRGGATSGQHGFAITVRVE